VSMQSGGSEKKSQHFFLGGPGAERAGKKSQIVLTTLVLAG
jgi:hypothetical protein